MRMVRWQIPVGVCVLALSMGAALVQAEENAQQVIDKLKSKAESAQSASADMQMTTTMMGQNITMKGTMLFQAPKKNRMEIDMSLGNMKMQQTIVSDGKTVWTYQPTMKMVSKIDLEKVIAATGVDKAGQQASSDITSPFGAFKPDTVKLLGAEELGGVKTEVFEGMPQTAELPNMPFKFSKMKIWVGADDGLLRKMVWFDENAKEMMSQTYDNIQTGIDIPASKFEFTPPVGVQVMDMTEGTINMIKSMKKTEK